ncbi:hypothetical protein PNH38_16955 [Anoxybacillus rupiensis]|uniref:DUF4162 domain-containing protein n=1 Tax=Anoxybacteroides rupiense TaxID=311460 RepID=A0ABT5W889_9BACL|nr:MULTISPECIES: hypothetical protein [Anoxybacillus]MBS2771889.1 hypothetical protein [Anoxybacillus rupiensis]MDE8565536.1 hypothetical protein [Anoxybacillus rupiensis]QHC02809.1 hypothetical protein GRQ40_01525 [Anoxybacillus sp. PDR2]
MLRSFARESDIPKLIHYLSRQNIDIYEVKVEKATLEDIFFDRVTDLHPLLIS